MTGREGTADALELFGKITDACAAIVASNRDWGLSGQRESQYSVDLLVDAACVPPLLAAGYSVLSEDFARPLLEQRRVVELNPGREIRFEFALAWYPRHEMPAYFAGMLAAIR